MDHSHGRSALHFGPRAAALAGAAALLLLGSAPAHAAAKVDFTRDVLPILQRACVACHGPEKANGGLQLVSARRLRKGGISDDLIVPGDARKSYLAQRLRGEGGEDKMPLGKTALPPAEIALIERWIAEGARMPDDGPPRFIPAPGGLKRLTVAQYHDTVRDLFGPAVALPTDLEPDTLVAGSATVGAAKVALSPVGVEKFAAAAADLGAHAARDAAFVRRHLPCADAQGRPPARLPSDCARALVTGFGKRAWRRPLTGAEIDRYARLAGAGDGATTTAAIVAALVQSPHFLYRSELGVPDPSDPTRRLLTPFELATRLAYFLTGGPPDEALMAAAESGQLGTPEGLASETRRLLQSPRSRATLSAFFVELFRLRRLDKIHESRTKYPQYSKTIAASMRGETLRVIEEIAFSPTRDFREIFSADFTYVNRELARLYGFAADVAPENGYARVPLPPGSGRAGVLAQGSFLTIFAHATSTSPTKRGKFIREGLLCQAVPPPPPGTQTRLPKDEGKQQLTTRQKLEAHRKDVRCNGCHKAMDPLGLAFEHFDGIGAHRKDEAGLPIDTSGELDGQTFRTPGQLGALLAKSPKLGACVARSLFRFAVGHLESEGEEPLLEALAQGLERDGYKFDALVVNVIKSEGFRTVAAPARARRSQGEHHAAK